MKILITGGAGFIGSAVVRLAVSRGYNIVNVDSLTYAGNLANLALVESAPNYCFEEQDITDRDAMRRLFSIHTPDAVMHLAAESHVDRSIDEPSTFITTNILGTYNMLECSREYWDSPSSPSTFRFHHVSTDEVYGSLSLHQDDKFSEETPYNPRSPYSASKASSDHLVRAWGETYNLPTLTTNCSNNYGPFHYPEKLIPLVIINALSNIPIPIYGDGSNVRDWLYVEDHANALLEVLYNGEDGASYNIGGDNELSNLELVTRLCAVLDEMSPRFSGRYSELISFVNDRPGHDERYAIDSSRLRSELGWKPKVDIDEGLKATVAWYLDNKDWWEPLLTS